MEFIIEHRDVLLLFALSLSEVLALIPKVEANSIFQLVYFKLKKLKPKI
jgi:hypothetical protein